MVQKEVRYKDGTIVSIFYSSSPPDIYAKIDDKYVFTLRQFKRKLKKKGIELGQAVKAWRDSYREAYNTDNGFSDTD
jgi:hypothetical protein